MSTPVSRSNRRDVRNPVLALPEMAELQELLDKSPPELKPALQALLARIATVGRQNAEHCWRKHKAPMATYWKGIGVYAKHIGRAL